MEVLKTIKVGKFTHLGKTRKGQLHVGHEDGKGGMVWVRVRDVVVRMDKSMRGVMNAAVKGLGRV